MPASAAIVPMKCPRPRHRGSKSRTQPAFALRASAARQVGPRKRSAQPALAGRVATRPDFSGGGRLRAAFTGIALALFVVSPSAITLVSVPQEIEIGREANAQVRKKAAVVRDSQVITYVARVGQRLAKAAPGAKYPYTFAVADYREINAFSLPGGPVWINRGVLHASTNESQVAGVLAHEIAHISQRHAADQLTNTLLAQWSLGALGAMLGNTGGAGAAQIAGTFVTNGVFLKFSRDDERAADRVGVQIMTKAGWDPRGMIELLDVLRREQKRDPGAVDVFFSTHPSPEDRIAQLTAAVGRRRGGVRDSAQFRAVKARVLKLPPPHRMPRT